MLSLTRRAALGCALVALAALPLPASAHGEDDMHSHLHIDAGNFILHAPYIRAMGPMARSGAAFMGIENVGDVDDRLIGVKTDVARKPGLHTNIISADGVAKMVPVKEGFPIPAGQMHMLQRGGDHIMLMGLTRKLKDGDLVTITLIFEKAGEVTVQIPVDNSRAPMGDHDEHMNMDNMNMDNGSNG